MFYIGLDLGQRQDHSAIAVLQKPEPERIGVHWHFGHPTHSSPTTEPLLVRYLERIPLGTSYPSVVARVRSVVQGPEICGHCSLAVDGTGVGAPVVEMLRAERLGCEISAVTITGGDRAHTHSGSTGPQYSVPKQDLIAGLQVLLERGELKIAKNMRDAAALVRELIDMRVNIGHQGRVKIGASGTGQHDDLVIALALACWRAKRRHVGVGTQRLTGI